MHNLLCTGGLGKISEALYNKYKSSQLEHASTLVSEFYLATPHENCLFFLEGLPDVDIVAKAIEDAAAATAAADAATAAAAAAAAVTAAAAVAVVEVPVEATIDEAEPVSSSQKFSDSGYGSIADGFSSESIISARVSSVQMPPTPSTSPSSAQ